jgi:aerobic carbon-monoxide dehydrogenase medium subunit
MYSPDFNYYRAGSVAEASDLLKKNPGAKILAGGHSLIPLLKFRLAAPPALIDIGRIAELQGVTVKDGVVRIGALTTHAQLAASADVRKHCPALAEGASHVGDPAVRNRGTIGGNVAHADPASDLPTVLSALGARFVVSSGTGTKTVEDGDFFKGMMTTALAEHDLLVAIEVPVLQKGQGAAYAKFTHPASRYAVIGAAATVTVSGGNCSAASVAIGGLVPRPMRASAVEKALVGQALSADTIAKAAGQIAQDLDGDIIGDLYASAEYRKSVAPIWVKRALSAAADRAR